ncbi:MAG TPA: tRNA (N6-threonylcarbamoyladenosine(37)-N6)-methyltransferase TrmO [Nitrospirota bacterium]|nr:tRNA (N6-threonylcarbamoyladenosine(37)-N6)-methyltransferase TrmO [Nitrospirota bacterium]
MNEHATYLLHPIGIVRSVLIKPEDAPRQGFLGAPEAWIEIYPQYRDALQGVNVNDEVTVLTWFHLSDRSILKVHPRSDPSRPLTGVFATRAPVRPNPIGLHRVTVLEIVPARGIRVQPLEAVDGTPVIDIKAVLREAKD